MTHKRTISVLLAIFFIKSFAILFGMSIPLHMVMGSVAGILSVAHICVNRQWIASIRKAWKEGKLTQKTKWQYRVDLVLVLSWSICIFSGILIGFSSIIYTLAERKDLFFFFVIHLFSAMLCLVLVLIHIIQHLNQIKAYFKKKQQTYDC